MPRAEDVPECDPQMAVEALYIGWTRAWMASGSGSSSGNNATRYNDNGQLTNGIYTISESKMLRHLPYAEESRMLDPENGLPKSVLLSGVDPHQAVLDAAQYADDNLLWDPATNKADVLVVNGPAGVSGESGELVNGITVSRTSTGFVHGWPNQVP